MQGSQNTFAWAEPQPSGQSVKKRQSRQSAFTHASQYITDGLRLHILQASFPSVSFIFAFLQIICAIPDLDSSSFFTGIRYCAIAGHRGRNLIRG